MTQFSRAAFEKGAKDTSAQRNREDLARSILQLKAAAVAQERLTGSPEWDAYLRMAEALQEKDRAGITALQGKLSASEYLEEGSIARLRHDLSRLQAKVEARDQLIQLPREILESARRVRAEESA